MLAKVTTVIFDKDGTVVDTEPLHLKMWVSALKERGYPATDEILKECIGLNYPSMDTLLKGYFGESFDIWEHYEYVNLLVKEYELENGIPVKKGFTELSDYLISRGIRSVVATSSMHEEAQFCLKQAGIGDRFDFIVGGDEIENGKPAPDIFLKAAEKAGASPDECVIFEDSSNGVRAALAAGIKCFYIPDMKEIEPELQSRTIKLASLDKAIEIIDKMI
ncbi:MAG: HAD family hydrolase [Ruminiclostridium sp.]